MEVVRVDISPVLHWILGEIIQSLTFKYVIGCMFFTDFFITQLRKDSFILLRVLFKSEIDTRFSQIFFYIYGVDNFS